MIRNREFSSKAIHLLAAAILSINWFFSAPVAFAAPRVRSSGNSRAVSLNISFSSRDTMPVGEVGKPFNADREHFYCDNGNGKYLFGLRVKRGSLPDGLDFVSDAQKGNYPTVVGVPHHAGSCTLIAQVKDGTGRYGQKEFTLTVSPPSSSLLVSSPAQLPEADANANYEYQLVASGASGDSGEYKWSFAGGRLPEGMYVTEDGKVSGHPHYGDIGQHFFDIQVETENDEVQVKSFTLSVGVPLEDNSPLESTGLDASFDEVVPPENPLMVPVSWNSLDLGVPSGVGGVMDPEGVARYTGRAKVSPKIATNIVENLYLGDRAGFNPSLGRGGCSWFTIKGNPWAGFKADAAPVVLTADVTFPQKFLVFHSAELEARKYQILRSFDAQFEAEIKVEVLAEVQKKYPGAMLEHKRVIQATSKRLVKIAESKMWEQVGAEIRRQPRGSRAAKVIFKNSSLSQSPKEAGVVGEFRNGEFFVTAEKKLIRPHGGAKGVLEALLRYGVAKEATVAERAAAVGVISRQVKFAKVARVAKIGGKILIVVAIAADAYEIYKAKNRVKAIVTKVGGWVGAWAGATVFGVAFATAEAVPGPGTIVHGVATLFGGIVGYYVGSETTRRVYEMFLEEKPRTPNSSVTA